MANEFRIVTNTGSVSCGSTTGSYSGGRATIGVASRGSGMPDPAPSAGVKVAGQVAEKRPTVPIRRHGRHPEVVLRMTEDGPAHERLPDLGHGGEMLISAEIEVRAETCVPSSS